MNWEDERYVRLYVRDTGDWCALSWDAQALLMQLLRKADRAGIVQLGKRGRAALPAMLGHHTVTERIDAALSELLEDGCVEMRDGYLVIPNFLRAQESKQSDRLRQQESRARRLADARTVSAATDVSQPVTASHDASPAVTSGHSVPSRAVPSRAVPSHATPNQTEESAPAAQAPVSPSPGLPGIDPGTQEKPSKAPKAKRAGGVTQEVAALAETLLEELSAAIQRVRPGARVLRPIPGNVEHIAARLADGATAEEVRHVIAVCEAESRHNPTSLQYFNPVSPFRRDNFARHLARTLEDAAKPDRARGAWRDPTVGSNTGQHTPEQEWDAWRRK